MYIYIMYTYHVYNVSANLCISAIKLEKNMGKTPLISFDWRRRLVKKMRVFHCQVWFPGSFGGVSRTRDPKKTSKNGWVQ